MASISATNLREDGRQSVCQVFLENCQRLAVSKGTTMDEVFDEVFASTKESLQASRESFKSAKSDSKRDRPSEDKSPPKTSLKLDSIFEDEGKKV